MNAYRIAQSKQLPKASSQPRALLTPKGFLPAETAVESQPYGAALHREPT